jgi:5-methylcytosine-specific restriction endonuclease McrA
MITESLGSLTRTLKEFWLLADQMKGIVERLDLLQEFATRRVYRKRRYKTIRNKRLRVRKGTICWSCRMRNAHVRHHIVQVQFGGANSGDCTVPLCHGCHAVVHPWIRRKLG